MRVVTERVDELDAVQKGFSVFGRGPSQEATPACVDMMPDVILFSDFVDGPSVIEATEHRGARERCDLVRFITFSDLLGDSLVESLDIHLAGYTACRNLDDVIQANTGDSRGTG